METFTAKDVILASGGAGQCFKPTTNALICTGDGIAQAYQVGAPLMDMEMIQYHPTTLAENGFLITEGARGEGAHLLNSDGRALHGEVRARTRWSSPRATSSRAPSRPRSTRAAASAPTARASTSTSPSSRRSACSRRCARSSTSARTSPASTSPREPILIRPGQHYIMGGVKTDVDGADADRRALRRRRGRLRLGPRRQPPRRQLAARHADLRPPLRRARRRARAGRWRCPMPPSAHCASDVAQIDAIIGRARRRAAAISEIKDELGTTMNRNVAVFRDEEGLQQALEVVAPPQGGGQDRLHRRPRHGLQPGRARRDRARLHARLRRGDRRRRDRAQGVARRAVPHRLPGAQRRRVAQAHRHLAQRRRRAEVSLLAGDDHPVAARGAQVLWPPAWPPQDSRLRIRRYDPESGEAPYWDEHTVDLEPHRSVLEGILQAKARFDGSIGIRCSCRAAICGSCGVRINGQPGLACHTHLDARAGDVERRRHRGRADGQHARHQGPDRRHGRGPLEEDPARHAVAHQQAADPRARVHRRRASR